MQGTITSGTMDYPAPKDVIITLIKLLIARNMNSAWAHVELKQGGGLLKRLFGKPVWVEVGFVDQSFLQLNIGKALAGQHIPAHWVNDGGGIWRVPITDLNQLIEWIDLYLTSHTFNDKYQVSGYVY
jgi:hypothetical protein